MKMHGVWRSVFPAFLMLLTAANVRAGEAAIRLASGGSTVFSIVIPDTPSPEEAAAAADFAHYLKVITGADFPVLPSQEAEKRGSGKRLYVGRRAPSDARPLAERERRVRQENGDLYFYGRSPRDGAFAVFDFLEKYFGCRWFSLRGNEKIPENREPVLPVIAYQLGCTQSLQKRNKRL